MRFFNVETGSRIPTTSEEMQPLQEYFAERCDMYFDLALEQAENPANDIRHWHTPAQIIYPSAPSRSTKYAPARDTLDAPIDENRMSFIRFHTTPHPGYMLQTYIPQYGQPLQKHKPPNDAAKNIAASQYKTTLEVVDTFEVGAREGRPLHYRSHGRRTVKLAENVEYPLAYGTPLTARTPASYLRHLIKPIVPFLNIEESSMFDSQGPYAFIFYRAGQVLTAAALMASVDPSEPANHRCIYTKEESQ